MKTTEDCLIYLKNKEWLKLNELLSDDKNCSELAKDPIFNIFETNLLKEVNRYEVDDNEDLSVVITRIFHLSQNSKILKLTDECIYELAEYLFQKHPCVKYAKYLTNNSEAQDFLNRNKIEQTENIEKTILASSLDVKIGNSGKLDFSKSIFNSPQEKELYLASEKILNNVILLPNIAISSIINSKILDILGEKYQTFFFTSTLDLCIVDSETFKPRFFIELDSSWHDKPYQIEKDKMKDVIFEKAGMKLHRLRKKGNKTVEEAFILYVKEYLTTN